MYSIRGDWANSISSRTLLHLSVPWQGVIPSMPSDITATILCKHNTEEQIPVSLTLDVEHILSGRRAHGFPLKISITKLCKPELSRQCYRQCLKNGTCFKRSSDPGVTCDTAICFPRCQHEGVCVAPGKCQCRNGYIGPRCEGGICHPACLNGGKCVQKDKCHCSKGFYGDTCQYSRCVIPCQHGGTCVGVNVCRCRSGFLGDHCQKREHRRSTTTAVNDRRQIEVLKLKKQVRCRRHRRCKRRVCSDGKCWCLLRRRRHQRSCRH